MVSNVASLIAAASLNIFLVLKTERYFFSSWEHDVVQNANLPVMILHHSTRRLVDVEVISADASVCVGLDSALQLGMRQPFGA